jgi:hypothetical protein
LKRHAGGARRGGLTSAGPEPRDDMRGEQSSAPAPADLTANSSPEASSEAGCVAAGAASPWCGEESESAARRIMLIRDLLHILADICDIYEGRSGVLLWFFLLTFIFYTVFIGQIHFKKYNIYIILSSIE